MKDWKSEADLLRAEGLSIRQIAARVGKSRAVVGEHFKPARCACGNVRDAGAQACHSCYDRERAAAHERYIALIVEMYVAGVPISEMAERMGTTRGGLNDGINKARKRGLIGYRYAMRGGKRAAA